jgi:hypothetical protein
MRLLATGLIVSSWLFYLVVKSFAPLNSTLQKVKKMTLSRRWRRVWGFCKSGNLPPAESIEQTKIMFPSSSTAVVTATRQVEMAITQLKDIKNQIKNLEAAEEQVEVAIQKPHG